MPGFNCFMPDSEFIESRAKPLSGCTSGELKQTRFRRSETCGGATDIHALPRGINLHRDRAVHCARFQILKDKRLLPRGIRTHDEYCFHSEFSVFNETYHVRLFFPASAEKFFRFFRTDPVGVKHTGDDSDRESASAQVRKRKGIEFSFCTSAEFRENTPRAEAADASHLPQSSRQ